jgi:hypothetical protein
MNQDADKNAKGGYFYTVHASIAPVREDLLNKKP